MIVLPRQRSIVGAGRGGSGEFLLNPDGTLHIDDGGRVRVNDPTAQQCCPGEGEEPEEPEEPEWEPQQPPGLPPHGGELHSCLCCAEPNAADVPGAWALRLYNIPYSCAAYCPWYIGCPQLRRICFWVPNPNVTTFFLYRIPGGDLFCRWQTYNEPLIKRCQCELDGSQVVEIGYTLSFQVGCGSSGCQISLYSNHGHDPFWGGGNCPDPPGNRLDCTQPQWIPDTDIFFQCYSVCPTMELRDAYPPAYAIVTPLFGDDVPEPEPRP